MFANTEGQRWRQIIASHLYGNYTHMANYSSSINLIALQQNKRNYQ